MTVRKFVRAREVGKSTTVYGLSTSQTEAAIKPIQ